MAVSLLGNEVSELCIGKPALKSFSASANTVADALFALKSNENSTTYLSVWSSAHDVLKQNDNVGEEGHYDDDGVFGTFRCVGKVCMVDIVCFLCKEENFSNPAVALQKPISVLLSPKAQRLVRHLDPHASILEAIDLILEGAQNLVVPIEEKSRRKRISKPSNSTLHNDKDYCWITQEDIVRYILNSIGLFCPTSIQTINSLNIIEAESVLAVHCDDPAISALSLITQSLIKQTSVAVVDSDRKLMGEIAPFMLNCCDESVTAAILTLSAGDLMAYLECGGPPDDLVHLIKKELDKRNMKAVLELIEEETGIWSSSSSSYSSSSDDECGSWKNGRMGAYSARTLRRSESSVCSPSSSLVAIMFQALAHRINYVWVVEGDGTLVGVVTFAGILKVLREYPNTSGGQDQDDKASRRKN